jgi:glucoamylase
MAQGVLTEVFFPAPDRACVRALGFLVADGRGFTSDEATQSHHECSEPRGAVPLGTAINRCVAGRYRIEKETLSGPHADVVLQRVAFRPTAGAGSLRLFCVLEPHLGDRGDEGSAQIGEHRGQTLLLAHGPEGIALALACSRPWLAATVGFAGTSDGRVDIRTHGQLGERYLEASLGNVVLIGEIDHDAACGTFTLALGFGARAVDAVDAALDSLERGYDAARADFSREWEAWSAGLGGGRVHPYPRLWTRSTTVLKTLEAKRAGGGRVAALSTPWGAARGPGIDGTYHLVWTRDLVEGLGALLAAGARDEVKAALHYLKSTQSADGSWPQNMRLSGDPVWTKKELDEVALPIVFLHLLDRDRLLTPNEFDECWTLVQRAAGFLARRGPSTPRDRWEDTEGWTPFTIATEIVALLIAAEMSERRDLPTTAAYLRELADEWNDDIEPMLYRRGGPLAEHIGVDGYYVRSRRPGETLARDLDLQRLPKTELSPDALALVRFGLRAADDPRIGSTVRVIDAVLKAEFGAGPCWRRYPGDEYGEHEDGGPFDGGGIGRPWPLLTGERAHYELARGRPDLAASLLRTMEAFANSGGMLPEQVWDQADVPERGLVRGAASGSAAPLGWAHAEYVKLCRSLADGTIFDRPAHAYQRYVRGRSPSRVCTWWPGTSPAPIGSGKTLRVALTAPGIVEWTMDGWRSSSLVHATDSGVGVFYADLPSQAAAEIRLRVHGAISRDRDGVASEVVFAREQR